MSALIQPSVISFAACCSLVKTGSSFLLWEVGALILPAATILYISFTLPYDSKVLHRSVLIWVRYACCKRHPE
ncbi:MAG TPA: hypothetical protein VGE06_09965 [Flavisolibacter sp.]